MKGTWFLPLVNSLAAILYKVKEEDMEPFNKILHKELIVLGWVHNRHKEYFEETGGVESGPSLYHEPAYDSYTMGKLVVIISKDGRVEDMIISENGRVEDMFIELNDDDYPNYPVS